MQRKLAAGYERGGQTVWVHEQQLIEWGGGPPGMPGVADEPSGGVRGQPRTRLKDGGHLMTTAKPLITSVF